MQHQFTIAVPTFVRTMEFVNVIKTHINVYAPLVLPVKTVNSKSMNVEVANVASNVIPVVLLAPMKAAGSIRASITELVSSKEKVFIVNAHKVTMVNCAKTIIAQTVLAQMVANVCPLKNHL